MATGGEFSRKDDLSKPWTHAPVTLYEHKDVKLELVDYYSRSETIANTSDEPFSSLPYLEVKFKLPAAAQERMGGPAEMGPFEFRYNHRMGFTTEAFPPGGGMRMGDINLWRIKDAGEFAMFPKCIPTRQVEGNGMVVFYWKDEPVDFSVDRLLEEKKAGKPMEIGEGLSVELLDFAKRLDLNQYFQTGKFVDVATDEPAAKEGEGENPLGEAKKPRDFPAVHLKLKYQGPEENGKKPAEQTFEVVRFCLMPFLHYLPIADTLKSNSKLIPGLLVEYFHPMSMARIDIVEGPANTLNYRVWQQKTGRIVSSGALEVDKPVDAFSAGGGANVFKMSLVRYIPQTAESPVRPGNPPLPYAVLPLPFNKDAADAKMTRQIKVRLSWKDKEQPKSKEFWLRQNLPEPWEPVRFNQVEQVSLPEGHDVQLTYRPRETPVGFTMRLDDFELKKVAGVAMASNYTSHVSVFPGEKTPTKDEKGKDFIITMNAPLDYPDPQGRTLRFFQENYMPPEGKIPAASVFRVNYDPGRWLKYLGSLLITVGIFLMFYMRAYFFKPTAPKTIKPAAAPAQEPASAQPVST
ncbi:MAG: hypothetical protein U0903_20935 [Planctomycetales bacterium]